MNVDYLLSGLGSSLEGLKLYTETLTNAVVQSTVSLKSVLDIATESFSSPIEFSPLQLTLLKVVLFILLANCILIVIYWRKYGTVITDKFIRPSTLKEIEELKLSVAKLKLPKEHSPRI